MDVFNLLGSVLEGSLCFILCFVLGEELGMEEVENVVLGKVQRKKWTWKVCRTPAGSMGAAQSLAEAKVIIWEFDT